MRCEHLHGPLGPPLARVEEVADECQGFIAEQAPMPRVELVRSKGRKFEKARGRRSSRGYKK